MICPRCKTRETSESCWYCPEDICYECWELIGHCGHPEAHKQNAEAMLRGDGVKAQTLENMLSLIDDLSRGRCIHDVLPQPDSKHSDHQTPPDTSSGPSSEPDSAV